MKPATARLATLALLSVACAQGSAPAEAVADEDERRIVRAIGARLR